MIHFANPTDSTAIQQPFPGFTIASGTGIRTPLGQINVEYLSVGDIVETLDDGPLAIRQIDRQRIAGTLYQSDRRYWPVRIRQAALGFGLPVADLLLAGSHRLLYRHIRLPLLFGEDAALVEAKSLCAAFGDVAIDSSMTEMTYHRIVLERHAVILANGMPVETYAPTAGDLGMMTAEDRERFAPYLRPKDDLDYLTLRSWELMAMLA